VRDAGREFSCCPEQQPISIAPHLLGPLLLLGRKRVGELLFLREPPSVMGFHGKVLVAAGAYRGGFCEKL